MGVSNLTEHSETANGMNNNQIIGLQALRSASLKGNSPEQKLKS